MAAKISACAFSSPLRIGADKIVAAKSVLAFDERRQKFHGRAAAFGSGKLDQVAFKEPTSPVTRLRISCFVIVVLFSSPI